MHVASRFINCGYDVPSPSRFDATNQSFSRPFPRDLHQLSLSLSPSARCNYYADKLQPESEFDCVRQLAGTRRFAKLGDRKFEISESTRGVPIIYTLIIVMNIEIIKFPVVSNRQPLQIFFHPAGICILKSIS